MSDFGPSRLCNSSSNIFFPHQFWMKYLAGRPWRTDVQVCDTKPTTHQPTTDSHVRFQYISDLGMGRRKEAGGMSTGVGIGRELAFGSGIFGTLMCQIYYFSMHVSIEERGEERREGGEGEKGRT